MTPSTQSSVSPASLLKRSEDLVHSTIDGEVVMMSVDQGQYFGLNSVGSHIWNLLETPMTVERLCQSLMERFEVDESQCQSEVARFLDDVVERKIVTVVG